MIFIVLSSLEAVHDIVQYRYCIFSLLNRLLRIRVKRQNPLLSYARDRERESTLQMFNVVYSTRYYYFIYVDNVLRCVIYQLNFKVFMHVTRISRYMTLYRVIEKDGRDLKPL